ncbi:MAG: methylmalonyl-CoA mutase [Desulfobacteraceae bacterium 4484_190.1]|nr:cobalamin B12-binding domain-containing protein [Syntrophobacterales bacterium]OPX35164.1 MAG: methylmalonyl-CoA mutase [Desulfobacteraceae bacterium 4484_190.1]
MVKHSIRILLAKPGLDGHDRGAKFLARALRDAGMEVIYTGLHQKIPQIVVSALQEDVDVVGLSILSGSHLGLTKKFFAESEKRGLDGELVLVGGTIPEEDFSKLREMGVDGVFGVESDIDDIVNFIREHVPSEK